MPFIPNCVKVYDAVRHVAKPFVPHHHLISHPIRHGYLAANKAIKQAAVNRTFRVACYLTGSLLGTGGLGAGLHSYVGSPISTASPAAVLAAPSDGFGGGSPPFGGLFDTAAVAVTPPSGFNGGFPSPGDLLDAGGGLELSTIWSESNILDSSALPVLTLSPEIVHQPLINDVVGMNYTPPMIGNTAVPEPPIWSYIPVFVSLGGTAVWLRRRKM